MKKLLLLLLLAASTAFLTGCRTDPDTPSPVDPILGLFSQLPITEAADYYEQYSSAQTLEEQRAVLVLMKEDFTDSAFAVFIPRLEEEIERKDRQIEERDRPEPTPAPQPEPKPDDDECDPVPFPARPHSFLWKPVSERGTLVILPDRDYAGHIAKVELRSSTRNEDGREHGLGNGCREHWRYGTNGAGFGQNITIRLVLKNGQVDSAVIPNGAQRYDRNIKLERK